MKRIRNDAASEHVIDVLTLGFAADPVMRWLYPEPHRYLKHFPETLRLIGRAAFDDKTALSTSDGRAAALWLSPRASPDSNSVLTFFRAVLSDKVLEDVYKIYEIMDEFQPDEPGWHLVFVATDPPSRGKGHGSALVDYMLPRCDAEQKVAYLENTNPANIAFYQRHGFEVLGEVRTGKAPPFFPMQRKPR